LIKRFAVGDDVIKLLAFMVLLHWSFATNASFLYKIDGEGQSGFLMGSFHHPFVSEETEGRRIEDAIRASSVVASESAIPVSELTLRQAGLIGKNVAVTENIPAQKCLMRMRRGLPTFDGKSLRPLFGAHPVLLALELFRLAELRAVPTLKSSASLDDKAMQIALQNSIPIYGIETAEEKLATLLGFDASIAEQWLVNACKLHTDSRKATLFDELNSLRLESFYSSEIETFSRYDTRLYREVLDLPEEFMEHFVYSRNRRIAAKIVILLKKGHKPFVLVGAAHMGGAKGIVSELRRIGFHVTPMR
jgi:TraB/PrgY/gumN family